MNLGEERLRLVNTSRPQLVHTPSKQSVTASDDYYSLTSEGSSNDDKYNFQRYETPPMHIQSANTSRGDALHSEAKQSEASIPMITRPIKHQDPGDEPSSISTSPDEQHRIKRKPVSSSSSEGTIVRRPIDGLSPPTPGIDDTPYIQFAIDQLTRDEEVVGPREQGHGRETPGYPVDRIVPDQGLHYNSTRRQRQHPDPNYTREDSPPLSNVLLPTEPSPQTSRYPKLTFVPRPLRILPLTILILCCLLMIAGLLFCAIYPNDHTGLWQYNGVGTGRYFVFQYLPTLLAILIIIWLFIIQCAIHRIFPFLVLSSTCKTNNSGVLHNSSLFPTTYLIPDMIYFKHKEPLLGMCSVIFWLALFTVPLQSCLFQTRYYAGHGIWRWTATQPIAWTLFTLYLLLTLVLVLLLLRFARGRTGLKWDPVSIADLISLFHRANFLSDFDRSDAEMGRHDPWEKHLRLGYWMTSRGSTEPFYGIGEENAPVRRYSLDKGRMVPVTDLSLNRYDLEKQESTRRATSESLRRDIHAPDVRYRWVPWFLREGAVLAWIITAIVLTIAFIVVSFVDHAVQFGFKPMLPAPTTTQGFSPADFLFSFVPSLIGLVLFLLWQPVDMYYRALQPFANLDHHLGCSADKSLLMDYTSQLPFEITLRAALDRHFKVAWISFMSILSITLPVLAGGVFTAQFIADIQDVRMAADMPAYYALVVFVVIYALSTLILWPRQHRYLPHDISTIGHIISFVYLSPLLAESTFREPTSKIDLQTKLMGTSKGKRGNPMFGFGAYNGHDGKEHLGITRMDKLESGQ